MSYDVVAVKHVGGYQLDLEFEDGRSGRVDLETYISKGGVFERFRDTAYFSRVEVHAELGTLCWPDGVDIAPEKLYTLATGKDPVPGASAASP